MLSLASPVTATVLSRNWTEEARVRVNNLQLQLFAASYNNWVWYTAQNIKTTKPMIPGRPVSLDSFNAVGQILFTKIFKIKFLKFCSNFFCVLAHRSCMPSFTRIGENCRRSSDLKQFDNNQDRQTSRYQSSILQALLLQKWS